MNAKSDSRTLEMSAASDLVDQLLEFGLETLLAWFSIII